MILKANETKSKNVADNILVAANSSESSKKSSLKTSQYDHDTSFRSNQSFAIGTKEYLKLDAEKQSNKKKKGCCK